MGRGREATHDTSGNTSRCEREDLKGRKVRTLELGHLKVLAPRQDLDELRSAVNELVELARLLLVDAGDKACRWEAGQCKKGGEKGKERTLKLGTGAERVYVVFDEANVALRGRRKKVNYRKRQKSRKGSAPRRRERRP